MLGLVCSVRSAVPVQMPDTDQSDLAIACGFSGHRHLSDLPCMLGKINRAPDHEMMS